MQDMSLVAGCTYQEGLPNRRMTVHCYSCCGPGRRVAATPVDVSTQRRGRPRDGRRCCQGERVRRGTSSGGRRLGWSPLHRPVADWLAGDGRPGGGFCTTGGRVGVWNKNGESLHCMLWGLSSTFSARTFTLHLCFSLSITICLTLLFVYSVKGPIAQEERLATSP